MFRLDVFYSKQKMLLVMSTVISPMVKREEIYNYLEEYIYNQQTAVIQHKTRKTVQHPMTNCLE